jgi:hypothetical protein
MLSIFTPMMMAQLEYELRRAGVDGVSLSNRFYKSDLSQRWALSGFLKDNVLAEKRLTALADQHTNAIVAPDGRRTYRPSAVSCYRGNLSSPRAWWAAWRAFMFTPLATGQHVGVRNAGGQHNATKTIAPIGRLPQLRSRRYPAIRIREERASLPLQALALAVYDATVLHLLNSLNAAHEWNSVRLKARRAPLIHACILPHPSMSMRAVPSMDIFSLTT